MTPLPTLAAVALTLLATAAGQDLAFFREYGDGPERPSDLATDGTDYYVVGGVLPSYSVLGGGATPGFLRKVDRAGKEIWVRRFAPSTLLLRPYGVAVHSGAVYVAGYSGGNFSTGTHARAFLRKFDASGAEAWSREFASERDTAAYGVAEDPTGVYVTGEAGTLDSAAAPVLGAGSFVRKYDHSGQLLWTRQIRVGHGSANGIATSAGRVYAVGASPEGSVLRSYTSDGGELWTIAIGPGPDFDSALAADSSGVFLARGGLLTAYGLDGAQLWQTRYADAGARLTMTASGIYAAGHSWKPQPGRCTYGRGDAIVRKYDREGRLLETRLLGGRSAESASGIAVSEGAIYVSGWIQASSPSPGSFFARLDEAAPENGSPRILYDCVANAGSYEASAIAPGEIVVVMGSSIGPPQLVPLRIENGRVATLLASTRVLFNGIPAPLIYASEKQTSAIVPAGVGSASTVEVQVEYRGARSNVSTLPVVARRPGMFTADGSGVGQAAALNEDGSINSPFNPAPRGSVIALFLTGAGPALPPAEEVDILEPNPARHVAAEVTVLFSLQTPRGDADAVQAEVLYAGASPGSVQGLVQLNVRIPGDAATGGNVPVYVEVGRGTYVQPGITVAVREASLQ